MTLPPQPPIEPEGLLDGLRPSAILLGAVVDIVFTLFASWLLVAWLAPEIFEAEPERARERLEALNGDPLYVLGALATGALGTVVGAYVGAARAGRHHLRHGGWIAVASAALGALLLLAEPAGPPPEHPFPAWAEALGWLLILPAGLAGGALARWRAGDAPGP